MLTRKVLKALTEGRLLLGMIGTLKTMWLLLLVVRCFWLRSRVGSTTAFACGGTCLVTCRHAGILSRTC